MVDGFEQDPIDGISMAYTFDDPKAPSARRTQYFEMFGDRAIYHEGWVAATTPLRAPWDVTGPTTQDPAGAFKWELYNITRDFSEADDLAGKEPQRRVKILPGGGMGFSR